MADSRTAKVDCTVQSLVLEMFKLYPKTDLMEHLQIVATVDEAAENQTTEILDKAPMGVKGVLLTHKLAALAGQG